MKEIEKSEEQIVFTAKISETLANSIRRYVSQIPILAVDELEIKRNDSALYDEAIAHRIGLVPLKMKKSAKKEEKLKLDVKGEKTVYSEDLKGNISVVYKKIPITVLKSGQKIKLTATVKSGKGTEHSKYSPGLIFYREIVEMTLDKSLLDDVKSACPGADIKEKGDRIIITDNKKKEIADVCEGIASKSGKKPETEKKEGLVITVESFGQMSPEDIFKESIDALKKDLKDLSKAVGKAKKKF